MTFARAQCSRGDTCGCPRRSAPVQRRAIADMDAPKADSIREDRATIDAGSASTPERGAGNLAAGGLARQDVMNSAARDDGAVTDMDAPKSDSIREDRATIEAESAMTGPLSAEQARHATTRNRHTTAVYHVRPADVGTAAAPDSPAFAQAVARYQQDHSLTVHGIVGPKTARAVHERSEQQGAGTASQHGAEAGGAGHRAAEAQPRASLLQMKQTADPNSEADVPAIAAAGVAGSGQPLPHIERIQTAFGHHDVSGIVAHVGGEAGDAAENIGAAAYATGNHVAFGGPPDLHTAAHEAAHTVQQRSGKTVQLAGGVGQVGDPHEQHADKVADATVRGESAEALLDEYAGAVESSKSPATMSVQGSWHSSEHGASQAPKHGHQTSARGRRTQSEDPTAWDAEYKKTDKSFGLVFNACMGVAGLWRDKASVMSPPRPDWRDLLLDIGSLALGGILGHVGGLLSKSLEPELSATVLHMVTAVGDRQRTSLATRRRMPSTGPRNNGAKREALYRVLLATG